jgi:hypothetical protein
MVTADCLEPSVAGGSKGDIDAIGGLLHSIRKRFIDEAEASKSREYKHPVDELPSS